ncbi:MAG TPA: acriflavin resistance protein, partial [bacterium]|nr:acriflavin resistance protein [bacterium]
MGPPRAAPSWGSQVSWTWVGVVPFFVFALMFLILPTGFLAVGGFQDSQGHFTLRNLLDLFQPTIVSSYLISVKVSAASAIGGALVGFALAYAAIAGGLPSWVRPTLMTFSGVASNFAGVPLAFAFLATLGRAGLVTALLINVFGFDIYSAGFNLLSFAGLTLTYMYFQIPLMVLIIAPAIDGLKREWREAAANLGAGTWEYWRYIALPIL